MQTNGRNAIHMSKFVLALNSGSSSLKFNLFAISQEEKLSPYTQGIVEEIGSPEKSRMKFSVREEKRENNAGIKTHREALAMIFSEFKRHDINTSDICAVGHRVVHGGEKLKESVRIDKNVIKTIRELIPIAPLHNPPNLTGIEESMGLFPEIPQVAVFDTAFHSTLPDYAYRYAIPEKWYSGYGVRKYGFHGTSHMYVSKRAARFLGMPFDKINCITAHLGNGCSITKVEGGESVDTSMGFTPLQGVAMGTRSGDIDSALIAYVADIIAGSERIDRAKAYDTVMSSLNRESGLKALAGTNMMQTIRERALKGDKIADMALSVYAYKIAYYIGAYWAGMPETHAVIFTAGVGENEGYVRKKILGFLKQFRISVDEEKNSIRKKEVVIGTGGNTKIMVIPTDEEIVLGYDAYFLGHLGRKVPEKYPFEE